MSQKKAQLFNPLNGNINVTGVVTAASFVGSGSGLTGVASTDNITTGTAATFTNNVNVSGIVTASGGFKGDLTGDVSSTFITGVAATFTGNVSIGGTLTYQDVTNIDSVGIITAQQGIQVLANGLDVTGFSTFKTGVSVTGVVTATSFVGSGEGLTGVASTDFIITGTAATFNNKVFVGTAITMSGSDGLHVTGVVTATSFAGDGSALTGLSGWSQEDTWLYGAG